LLKGLIKNISKLYPEDEWKFMKPGFFVTFWQLSLYDIQYPSKNYAEAEEKIKEALAGLNDTITELNNDHRREAHQALKTAKIRKEELQQQQSKLTAESMRHALHFEKSKTRLNDEKEFWFNYEGPERNVNNGIDVRQNQIKQFLSYCILPRTVHSPIDAIFCARMITLLHALGTPHFSTLTFFDKLFADGILFATLLTCTTYEAENLGLFLAEVLAELGRWRADSTTYDKFGLGVNVAEDKTTYLPGFIFDHSSEVTDGSHHLPHNNFMRALEKWHRRTTKSVVNCLRSEDYMHRRNTITLLKNMLGVFPTISSNGLDIIDALEDIVYKDDREDLKLAAQALLVHLKRAIPTWIEAYDFKPTGPEAKEKMIEVAASLAKEREKKMLLRTMGKSKPKTMTDTISSGAQTPTAHPSSKDSPTPATSSFTPRLSERNSSSSLPASLPKIPTGPRRDEPGPTRVAPSSSHSKQEVRSSGPGNLRGRQTLSSREKQSNEPATSVNSMEIKPRAGRPVPHAKEESSRPPSRSGGGKVDSEPDGRRGNASKGAGDRGRGNVGGDRVGKFSNDNKGGDRASHDRHASDRFNDHGNNPNSPNNGRTDARPKSEKGNDRGDSRNDSRKDSRSDFRKSDTKGGDRGNRSDSRGDSRNDSRNNSRDDSRGELRYDSRADTRNDTRNDSRNDLKSDARNDSRNDNKNEDRRNLGRGGNNNRGPRHGNDSKDNSGNSHGRQGTGSNAISSATSNRQATGSNAIGPSGGQASRLRDAAATSNRSRDSSPSRTPRPGNRGGEGKRGNNGRDTKGNSDNRDRGGNARKNDNEKGSGQGSKPDNRGPNDNRGGRRDDEKGRDNKPGRRDGPGGNPRGNQQASGSTKDNRKPLPPPALPPPQEDRRKSWDAHGARNANWHDSDRANNAGGGGRPDSERMESRQRNEKEREKRQRDREWDRDRKLPPLPPPPMDDRYRDNRDYNGSGGNNNGGGGSGGPGGRGSGANSGSYGNDRKHGRGGNYESGANKRRRTGGR
jgi:THO complex subunit 2